jgi:hypothetical protein
MPAVSFEKAKLSRLSGVESGQSDQDKVVLRRLTT